jgi:hypothetical protein
VRLEQGSRTSALILHRPRRPEDAAQMPSQAEAGKVCEEESDCRHCLEHGADGVDNVVIGEDRMSNVVEHSRPELEELCLVSSLGIPWGNHRRQGLL